MQFQDEMIDDIQKQLEERERLLASVFSVAEMGICITDDRGILLQVNRAFREQYGYAEDELVGKPFSMLIPDMDEQTDFQLEDEFLRTGTGKPLKWNIRRKDGAILEVIVTAGTIDGEEGRRYRITTVTDMNADTQTLENLRLAYIIFEHTSEGIAITDAQAGILMANRAFSEITGIPPEEIPGQKPTIFSQDSGSRAFYRQIGKELQEHGSWRGEIWEHRKNGEPYTQFLSITTVRNTLGSITNYIVIVNDITERKQWQERLTYLAYYDPMTGMPNRGLFLDRLHQATGKARRHGGNLAVLFLNVNRFKTVNESFGHAQGDELLINAAIRMREVFRESDTVAHFGGDRFAVIIDPLRLKEEAAVTAEKALACFARPFLLEDHEVHLSCAVGISLFPDDGETPELLIRNAESAMFRAKVPGKNQFRFYARELNSRARERMGIESDLRHAIERNELFLQYQPQIRLSDESIHGLEVLLRWRNEKRGMIPPSEFIPLAEESGQILALGEWVLQESTAQYARWIAAGLPAVTLAVNLSAVQFTQPDLPDSITRLLTKTGIAPANLELEITEGILMQNVERAVRILDRLKEQGIHIAIDDFGTGYSSLAYLKNFPVDHLKIDRSFVMNVETNRKDAAIVDTVLLLAHELEMTVIAEGTETAGQVEYLRRRNCSAVQGYYYYRPLDAEAAESLLRAAKTGSAPP